MPSTWAMTGEGGRTGTFDFKHFDASSFGEVLWWPAYMSGGVGWLHVGKSYLLIICSGPGPVLNAGMQ